MQSTILKDKIQVSVIIPSYKPQYWIWECLDSLKTQTFPKDKFEIVLILNGCNEPYFSDIEGYIGRELLGYHVNFIQTDQGGVSNARNIGIDNAKGEYLTFIDDDDYVSPSYLQELYDIALTGRTVVSNVLAFRDGENKMIDYYITNLFKKIQGRQNIPIMQARSFMSVPCAKILAKGIVSSRRFNVKYKNGEDSLFMFNISDKIQNLTTTSENAIYYRRFRENSAVTRKRSKRSRVENEIHMIMEYTRIYLSNIKGYSFNFYLSRIAAEIGCILGLL